MRVMKLDKYDPEANPVAVQARAWQIMWLAVNNYPAGNKEQTLVGNAVFSELREISEIVKEKGAEVGRRLKSSGTESYFEDPEWRLLGQAVDKFRENIALSGSDALLWVDKLLEKAPEVSKRDYIAKVKKLKLEPSSMKLEPAGL